MYFRYIVLAEDWRLIFCMSPMAQILGSSSPLGSVQSNRKSSTESSFMWFRHISTSGLGVGCSRHSFIAVFCDRYRYK